MPQQQLGAVEYGEASLAGVAGEVGNHTSEAGVGFTVQCSRAWRRRGHVTVGKSVDFLEWVTQIVSLEHIQNIFLSRRAISATPALTQLAAGAQVCGSTQPKIRT
jgi:hypothetical protein